MSLNYFEQPANDYKRIQMHPLYNTDATTGTAQARLDNDDDNRFEVHGARGATPRVASTTRPYWPHAIPTALKERLCEPPFLVPENTQF